MKLSAKFARQESEQQRRARIARKRISEERAEAIRRMLDLGETDRRSAGPARHRPAGARVVPQIPCPECDRRFALPMHLGRHLRAIHDRKPAEPPSSPPK